MTPEAHASMHDIFSETVSITGNVGLKFGEKVVLKTLEAGINTLIDSNHASDIMTFSNNSARLGNNKSFYVRTHLHVGYPTTSRVKKLMNTENVQYNQKDLSTSGKDYLESENRKNLILNSGFNQKKYTFFLEDTYITINNLFKTKFLLNLNY